MDLSPVTNVSLCVHVHAPTAGLPWQGILTCWEKEKPFIKKPTQNPNTPSRPQIPERALIFREELISP